jgi:DNA modification methylase
MYEYKLISHSSLKKYNHNSKIHDDDQVELLVAAIKRYGFTNPILVDESFEIIAGHCRYEAAIIVGMVDVPCIIINGLTNDEKIALRIADNRIAENSSWNYDQLNNELSVLKENDYDLNSLGFDDDFLSGVMQDVGEYDSELVNTAPDVDDVDSVTNTGDMWIMGNHRIICGSSADRNIVNKVLDGDEVDMLLTDPPYGVDYSAKNKKLEEMRGGVVKKERPIIGDNIDDYLSFFTDFLKVIPFREYNTCYIFMIYKEYFNLLSACTNCGIYNSQMLIWLKNKHVLSLSDYNPKHECIFYGWKGKHKFYGDKSGTTILEYSSVNKCDLHPTMKPVEILIRLIQDGSADGAIVYEPFGGSGSALIACEKTNRQCRLVEISPAYVDVIVNRWQDLTGKKAERVNANQ